MPAKVWPIWLYTMSLIVAFPIVIIAYYQALGASGILPPESDTIIIPIMGNLILFAAATPVIMLITWLCTRGYNPNARLLSWRHDRPIRSVLTTLLFGSICLANLAIATIDLTRNFESFWFDHMLIGYSLGWIPWLMFLRAAAIEQQ